MQDYIEELRAVVERCGSALARIPDAESARRPAPGKWSPREVIGHLIDSASNNHRRFVEAQFTGDLVFTGYRQDDWVRVQAYQYAPWPGLIALWRAYNLHIAHVMDATPDAVRTTPRARHNLDEVAWKEFAREPPATPGDLMADYVDHLKHHLRQIPGSRVDGA
jgi:hypothetical protein